MKNLPEIGFLRLPQIIGDPKANPPIPPIIPISRSSWLAGVKLGKYPAPIKLGRKVAVWKIEDIKNLVKELSK